MIESYNYNIFSVGSFILLSVIVVILAVFMSSNCSKQVEDCKEHYCHKIKERDYLFCIILLFIVIMFISTIAMVGDDDVAEYLSFAGTVSSIILSVLAIIMTILAEKKMEVEKIKTDNLVATMEACTYKTKENLKKIKSFETKIDKVIEKEEELISSQNEIKDILRKYEEYTNKIDEINQDNTSNGFKDELFDNPKRTNKCSDNNVGEDGNEHHE